MHSCTTSESKPLRQRGRLSKMSRQHIWQECLSMSGWNGRQRQVFDGPKLCEQMCFFLRGKGGLLLDALTCHVLFELGLSADSESVEETVILCNYSGRVSVSSGIRRCGRKCPRPNWCQVLIWLCSTLYSEVHLWQIAECGIWNPPMICHYGCFSLLGLNPAHIRKLVCV